MQELTSLKSFIVIQNTYALKKHLDLRIFLLSVTNPLIGLMFVSGRFNANAFANKGGSRVLKRGIKELYIIIETVYII